MDEANKCDDKAIKFDANKGIKIEEKDVAAETVSYTHLTLPTN